MGAWTTEHGMVSTTKHREAAGALVLLVLFAGCATPLTPRERGTLAGAGMGAATGAVLGGIAGSAGRGAAIGAAVGAVTGALAGDAIQREQARRHAPGYAYGAPPYPYYSADPPPPGATLRIEVVPDDTEIFVDGRRVGLAREFRGPVVVPVVGGPHFVEFRWRGFSVVSRILVPHGITVPVRRDLAASTAGSPHGASSGPHRRPSN